MINILINKILETRGHFDESRMGDIYFNCPFCEVDKLDEKGYGLKLEDLDHKDGCLFLLAKGLKK